MKKPDGIRAIALLEGFKGLLTLVVGLGLLTYLSTHAQAIGENLIAHLPLNPSHNSAAIFIKTLNELQNRDLWVISLSTLAYSLLRFAEAYGLWYHRRWAKWVAVISGGLYIPFEIFELTKGYSHLKISLLILNLMIVAYLGRELWKNQTEPN